MILNIFAPGKLCICHKKMDIFSSSLFSILYETHKFFAILNAKQENLFGPPCKLATAILPLPCPKKFKPSRVMVRRVCSHPIVLRFTCVHANLNHCSGFEKVAYKNYANLAQLKNGGFNGTNLNYLQL